MSINNNYKKVFLVQHGEAKSEAEDPQRSLTENGKVTVEKVATWAAQIGIQVDEIRHSGKTRAQQTAEIFAKHLNISNIQAVSGLAPLDDVKPVAEQLEKEERNLMLVGHLPFMNRLASQLLINNPEKTVVRFRMGGLVGLEHNEEGWVVFCIVPPEMVL